MRQTGRRGACTRAGTRGAILVSIALFGMLLVPALAGAVVAPSAKPTPAPVNTAAPTLTGTPALGQTLTCSTGAWANSPTSFSYVWLRNGVPIAGQAASTYVVQAPDQGHAIACQVTASNGGGNYTIGGLASGSYKVDFFSGDEGVNYLFQYYNAKLTEAEATPVSVTIPATTGGVNAELHAGGQINGRVTDAATHAPLPNVEVCAEDESIKAGNCAITSSSGEYTISTLQSGSYTVSFSPFLEETPYLSQYYNGKASPGEAQPVAVTAGATAGGINAELQSVSTSGQIAGTVTKAVGGQEIAGIEVCADDTSEVDFFGTCTTTDSKGQYTLSKLPEGSFVVSFSAENCLSGSSCTMQNYMTRYYNEVASFEQATPVTVLANSTTPGIDAKMLEGGQIKGRVTSASEAPLANVEVCAEGLESDGCASTDSNGEYAIEGLAEGSEYKVVFFGEGNYLTQYYNGKTLISEAEHVEVKVGATTSSVNAKLLEGGELTGRVTDASTHAPIANVEVCAEGAGEVFGGCANTNANGEYAISGLATDSYVVNFYPEDETNYLSQADSGASVTDGKTSSFNAELHAGGEITGRVTDATTHLGIAKVVVCADQIGGSSDKCAVTTASAASAANAASNALTVPGGNFTLAKKPVFDAKTDDLDFFFTFPSAGKLKWSLFFNNADVGFADSLGLSLGVNALAADNVSTQVVAEAAKKKKKSKGCKKGTIKHHGKCVHVLVPFGSGSQSVPAGTVEVKVHASSKAIKALKSGHTLHVSGQFTFQSALGGPAITHNESAVVRLPKKHAKKHGKGKKGR